MTAATELVGALSIGGSAVIAYGIAVSLGASSAHNAADRELEARELEDHRTWADCSAPPPPAAPPTCHTSDEAKPSRARHRKR